MTGLKALRFPAVLYREGYIYIARQASDLCIHPRRLFQETLRHTWKIADASGTVFRVTNWQETKPHLGWRELAGYLLGSVFAVPILERERSITAPGLTQELGDMIARNRMYAGSYDTEEQFREELAHVQTFHDLIHLLEPLP